MQELDALRNKIGNMTFRELASYIEDTVFSPTAESRIEEMAGKTKALALEVDELSNDIRRHTERANHSLRLLSDKVEKIKLLMEDATTDVE